MLDPFAGSGTTLFAASAKGFDAEGIELLPIGQYIIATKQLLNTRLPPVISTPSNVGATPKFGYMPRKL